MLKQEVKRLRSPNQEVKDQEIKEVKKSESGCFRPIKSGPKLEDK